MKHEISICGFLFMFFTLSCNEPVIDQTPLNQKQPESAQLKLATIGTTYYVSTSGNNKNPGSEQRPFLSADYAAAKVNPGDIVIFENGVYTTTPGKFFASLSRSGNSSAYITFKARNKGKAILDGQNNSAIGGFSITGSYINISGFEMKDMSIVGIEARNGASYLNFSDLNIHNIGRGAFQNDVGRTAFTLGTGSYIVVERCLVHTIGSFAPGENGTSYSSGWTGYQTLDHGIYISGSSHLTIKNNVFYNCKSGFAIQVYSGEGNPSSYVNIINNTFEDGNPFQKGGHIILWNSLSNSLIANNIFKNHKSYAIFIYQGSYGYSSVTITKNITSGGNGIISTGTATGISVVSNFNSTDPLFSNEASHDYSLKTNSPATISGYNTGLTTDYLNNTRTTTNIGAYGSSSSATVTIPEADDTDDTNFDTTPVTAPAVTTIPKTIPNNYGESHVYYNKQITGTATKNDCGSGYEGSKINYVVSANTFSSTISQIDADAKANAYVNANKQRNANEHGYCRPLRQ